MKSAVRIGSEKTMTNAQHTRGVQLCVDVCEVTSSQLQHYNMFFFWVVKIVLTIPIWVCEVQKSHKRATFRNLTPNLGFKQSLLTTVTDIG